MIVPIVNAVRWSRVASMRVNEWENCEKSIEMIRVSIVCLLKWIFSIACGLKNIPCTAFVLYEAVVVIYWDLVSRIIFRIFSSIKYRKIFVFLTPYTNFVIYNIEYFSARTNRTRNNILEYLFRFFE